jgi:hypothetical protein
MLPPGARKDALGRGICANPWKSVQARLTEWPLSDLRDFRSYGRELRWAFLPEAIRLNPQDVYVYGLPPQWVVYP